MNVLNNVALSLKYMNVSPRQARREAMELLERLGIKDQAKMLPNQISGGEKQRTAIARALITKPKIILADEPTGSVDPVTSRSILNLFREIIDEVGVSFLIVTHSREIAGFADRTLELVDVNTFEFPIPSKFSAVRNRLPLSTVESFARITCHVNLHGTLMFASQLH